MINFTPHLLLRDQENTSFFAYLLKQTSYYDAGDGTIYLYPTWYIKHKHGLGRVIGFNNLALQKLYLLCQKNDDELTSANIQFSSFSDTLTSAATASPAFATCPGSGGTAPHNGGARSPTRPTCKGNVCAALSNIFIRAPQPIVSLLPA